MQKGFVGIPALILLAVLALAGAYYVGTTAGPAFFGASKPNLSKESLKDLYGTQTPIPSPSPTPTSTSQKTIPSANLLSTKGWSLAKHTKFNIKYPSEKYEAVLGTPGQYYSEDSLQLILKGNVAGDFDRSPVFLVANDYQGGSRREWYMSQNSIAASEVGKTVFFKEKMLGNVSVLEVSWSTDNGAVRNILVAQGNTLINILPNKTDLILLETIVSTISFK